MFAPRLINPVIAEIYRLDAAATWAVDPPGIPDAGYDEVFKEFVAYDETGQRKTTRRERSPIEILVQVEQESYESLVATFGGDSPVTDTVLIMDRRHLVRDGIVDTSTGEIDIPKGSRISRLLHPNTREPLVPAFQDEFIYEVRPRSWGYRGKMNIYVVYLYRRERLGEM